MPLQPMYPAGNPVTVQLAQDITATTQAIAVTDAALFPAPPNFVTIGTEQDAEVVLYQAVEVDGSRLTGCQRGRFGTAPAAWPAGEFIYHAWGSDNNNTVMQNIRALAEEKAEEEALLRLEAGLAELDSDVRDLNEGKANAGEISRLDQALGGLSAELGGDIARLEEALALLNAAIAGLGGGGEGDPNDIARLEAAIVAVNQALAAKADQADLAALEAATAALNQALAAKADLTALEAALAGKAAATELSALRAEAVPRIFSVALPAAGWSESGGVYRRQLSAAVSDGEQADFSADMATLRQLAEEEILIHFENLDGTLYAVAGKLPEFDISAQATVYKVVSAQ